MIEISRESEGDVIVVRAGGALTDADYKNVLIPALDDVLARYGKINALVLLESPLSLEPAALWDDARYGMKHRADVGRMAVVGGPGWISWAMKVWALFTPGEFRAFPDGQAAAARRWMGLSAPAA